MVHCTSTQALQRLTTLCAKAEYCRQEIWRKLSRWQLADDPETDQAAKQEILNHLVSQHYIDEQRYAHAFVRDKFRYNRWGRMRIQQELYKRGIAEDVINRALEEELSDESSSSSSEDSSEEFFSEAYACNGNTNCAVHRAMHSTRSNNLFSADRLVIP